LSFFLSVAGEKELFRSDLSGSPLGLQPSGICRKARETDGRGALYLGADVFAVQEGYRGMIEGIVNDDQIKEARGKLRKGLLPLFRSGNGYSGTEQQGEGLKFYSLNSWQADIELNTALRSLNPRVPIGSTSWKTAMKLKVKNELARILRSLISGSEVC
jgi:hypothetical protein